MTSSGNSRKGKKSESERLWDRDERDKRENERGKRRFRLLERSYGCLNKTERERENERKRKVRREWWSYKEKLGLTERRGRKPCLQHCKRQRCALPGGHPDNMYRGPPATMSILQRKGRRDTSNLEREKDGEEERDREGRRTERVSLCFFFSVLAAGS